MRLVLIRHTSVAVPRGVCYGQTDVPLAASFAEEAATVKEGLADYTFDRVYCSPLSRCVRLAEYCGYPDAVRDDRLKEICFGDWEMRAYDDIQGPELQRWFDDYINVAPPGGESVIDQQRRFLDFIRDLRRDFSGTTYPAMDRVSSTPPETPAIALFTHGGILINALVALAGRTFQDIYADIPPYGSIIDLRI